MTGMSSRQTFTVYILGFVLLFVTVVGGYTYGVVRSVERILSSPAGTSEVGLKGNFVYEANGISINLTELSGRVNSKILDLIILATRD